MSQQPHERNDAQPREARVLELSPHEEGVYDFTLDPEATYQDLVATMQFVEPDREKRITKLKEVLRWGIETRSVLDNEKFRITDPSSPLDSDQVEITRYITFKDAPSMEDATLAFTEVYGDDADMKLLGVLQFLVDTGKFEGATIRIDSHNEFEQANPEDIATEMAKLTDEHYDL